jgi:hypothetical protein
MRNGPPTVAEPQANAVVPFPGPKPLSAAVREVLAQLGPAANWRVVGLVAVFDEPAPVPADTLSVTVGGTAATVTGGGGLASSVPCGFAAVTAGTLAFDLPATGIVDDLGNAGPLPEVATGRTGNALSFRFGDTDGDGRVTSADLATARGRIGHWPMRLRTTARSAWSTSPSPSRSASGS